MKGTPHDPAAAPLTALAEGFETPTHDTWLALVDKALKGADFERRLVSRTLDDVRIAPLYTRADNLEGAAAALPGVAPLTRGLRPAGSTAGWEVCQIVADADPAAACDAIKADLEAGAGAVALQLAAPGQYGLPATKDTLAAALDGVHLDMIGVALQPGAAAHPAASALAELYEASGTPGSARHAALNADPIGALARTGQASLPLAETIAAAAGLCRDPAWIDTPARIMLADGRTFHEAGATEGQELAAMLASAVAYLRAAEAHGLAPDAGLGRIGFALAVDADIFVSIAKLRAARRLIHRLAEACGAAEAAGKAHIWATTSQRMMARRDPWVNMLRTTAACMGAGIGGAETITVLPFSWPLGQPDTFARRIARNVHVIALEESGLGRVADPAGGAWYVEKLTDDLARAAWKQFQEIESHGGMEAALGSGFVQGAIAAAADARGKAIATGRQPLTGVSTYPRLGDDGVTASPWPRPADVCGGAITVSPLAPLRLAEPYEDLRERADAIAVRHGRPPQVFLAALGGLAEHAARTTFMQNFLAAGGIAAIKSEGFHNTADLGAGFADSGARVACICGTDDAYALLGQAAAGVLKQAGAASVCLAGRPKNEADLRAAGVDLLVFAGCDAPATLAALLDVLEASA